MELQSIVNGLSANAKAIPALLQDVSAEQARWRPSPESWSLLEVVCHLYDEEREDFRRRVNYTLYYPNEDFSPIDPAGWVISRNYNARDLAAALDDWLQERRSSVLWLESLKQADWNTARPAPWGGEMHAGDFLAAWLVHDFLHIRQINELLYAWHVAQSKPFTVGYAGDW